MYTERMTDRIPLTGGIDIADRLAHLAGGYDEDRRCFVAVSEVPDVPTVMEERPYPDPYTNGTWQVTCRRRGSVVIQGPAAVDPDMPYCVSPVLHALMFPVGAA